MKQILIQDKLKNKHTKLSHFIRIDSNPQTFISSSYFLCYFYVFIY